MNGEGTVCPNPLKETREGIIFQKKRQDFHALECLYKWISMTGRALTKTVQKKAYLETRDGSSGNRFAGGQTAGKEEGD